MMNWIAQEKAVSFINEQFRDDLANLSKAKQLYEHIESTKLEIEQKVGCVFKL